MGHEKTCKAIVQSRKSEQMRIGCSKCGMTWADIPSSCPGCHRRVKKSSVTASGF